MATLSKHLTIPDTIASPHGALFILAQGLLIRLLFMRGVAVNGDTGLYLYDALQLTWGRQMFVQFPGRSPTVEVPLAVLMSLFPDHRLEAARLFMIGISLLVGALVYLFTSEVYDRRVGISALAITVLTPFPMVWGMWVKTEQFAILFSLIAFFLTAREIVRDRPRTWVGFFVGVSFGLGALARRSIIVTVGAFSLFILWYFWRHRDDLWRVIPLGAAAAAGGLVTTFLPLLALSQWDVSLSTTVYDMYFLGLVESNGFGVHGYLPLLSDQYIPHQYSADAMTNTPWYWAFCGKCAPKTFLTMAVTASAALPGVVLLLPWLKARTERAPLKLAADLVPALLLAYAGFAAVISSGGLTGGIPFALFGLAVVYLWWLPTPDWETLWRPRIAMVFVTLLALTVGYLYRDRIIYPTYFQEFYPFMAILGGVALVSIWDHVHPFERPGTYWRFVRTFGAVLLLFSVVVGAFWSYPYIGDSGEHQTDWYTMDRVDAFGSDIDRRLDDGDRVFAANPLYVIESEHRLARDLSRKYYLFEGWPKHGATKAEGRRLERRLQSESVPMAVVTSETRTVLMANAGVNETFHDNYCPVQDPLYETIENTTVYYRVGDPQMPACGETIERSDGFMNRVK